MPECIDQWTEFVAISCEAVIRYGCARGRGCHLCLISCSFDVTENSADTLSG